MIRRRNMRSEATPGRVALSTVNQGAMLETLRVLGENHRVRTSAAFAIVMLAAGCSSDGGDGSPGEFCALVCEGEHEVCAKSTNGEECACAPGYEGDPCEWGTVPRDPEFASRDAWSDASSGVTILPSESGLGPGLVSFDKSAVCNGGVVSQVVEMPGKEVADPFVVEMTLRSSLVFGIDVYAGRALRTLRDAVGTLFVPERFCLGEAAYGGPVEFRIGAAERDNACESDPAGFVEVDRFQILVAEPGECPEPGSALNGEADPEEGGWFLDDTGVDPNDGVATAALEPGVGNAGTGGARIFQDGGGNLVTMGTRISVPLASSERPSPALQFWWKANDLLFLPELGAVRDNTALNPLDVLQGDGDAHVNTYCLPPWTHGSVVELWFVPVSGRVAGELVVDDVKVISDSRCGDSADVLDPQFDSAPNRWPGAFHGLTGVEEPVRILDDAESGSPSGGGAVALSYASSRAVVTFHNWVWVPKSSGAAGPQLVFYSNLPREPMLQVAGVLSRNSIDRPEDNLSGGVGWERNEYCLPSGWSDRWLRFRVEVRNRDSEPPPTQVFDPPKQVLLDDFQLTTSAACSADR